MRHALIPVALLGLVAAAPADKDPLAGRVAGKAVDCIDRSRVGGPDVIDSRTILYRETTRRIWRNDLPAACPGLRPTATLIIDAYGSRTCSNDTFRANEPGSVIPGPYCRLGKFTPYDLPGK